MAVHIEPVRAGDIPTLWTLIRELAEYERRLDQFQATEADLESAILGSHSPVEAVLAWHGHKAVGYALFCPVFSTFRSHFALYLEDTYGVPESRGQGVGRALTRYLAQTAYQRGWNRIEWQVLDWNTSAIEFYRRLGAIPKETEWVAYKLEGDALRQLIEGAPNP